DFEKLRSDTTKVTGWWKNRVTRILLVFLLSSLGSGIGTYVAGFKIFERLSG
ncbi:MAG: conjugal transfer protein TraB, partial [Gammaproteobacteria bacterium]|nr:conjugal transfer protein TraB [Gammaproteobacteria bacterium]